VSEEKRERENWEIQEDRSKDKIRSISSEN